MKKGRGHVYKADDRQIRKLRKHHIWPSLILFLCYIGAVKILLSAFMAVFTDNVVKTKFDEIEREAKAIERVLTAKLSTDEKEEKALSYVARENPQGAYAILNDQKEVLYQVGDFTADFTYGEITCGDGAVCCVYDLYGAKGWMPYENHPTLPYKKITRDACKGVEGLSKDWIYEKIYEEQFWVGVPVNNTGQTLYIRSTFELDRVDYMKIFGSFAVVALLLFIPVVICTINMISRFISQHRLYRLFYYDTVTQSKNWMYFLHYSQKLLSSYNSAAKTFVITDLELLKYRSICACYGVEAGEDLLQNVNKIINKNIGKKELCVRYAKSNFALLLNCVDEIECRHRIERLIQIVTEEAGKNRLLLHAGIYMVPPNRKETGRIVRRTHLNIPQMYNYASEARATIVDSEASSVAVFDQKMIEEQMWENWVENNMEQALENEEFVVYLQPKYNPMTDQLVGAEALVRWISSEQGFIPPNRFIPIFERNGFISHLDDYMISHVAKEQTRWLKEGKPAVPASVNVSRVHFASEDLAEHLCRLVDQYETPHHLIEFELTESAFFDNKKTLLKTVKKMKENGFEVSMDDFGSGYSSLNSLKDLPLDVLKIDAEFFRGEDVDKRGDIIVGEAIQLAKLLNMRTVAEGIETKEQIDFLAEHGCDMIQGFYYAKPMPICEYETHAFGKAQITSQEVG